MSILAKETSRASQLFKDENFLDEVIKLDSTNDKILGFSKLKKKLKIKILIKYLFLMVQLDTDF